MNLKPNSKDTLCISVQSLYSYKTNVQSILSAKPPTKGLMGKGNPLPGKRKMPEWYYPRIHSSGLINPIPFSIVSHIENDMCEYRISMCQDSILSFGQEVEGQRVGSPGREEEVRILITTLLIDIGPTKGGRSPVKIVTLDLDD